MCLIKKELTLIKAIIPASLISLPSPPSSLVSQPTGQQPIPAPRPIIYVMLLHFISTHKMLLLHPSPVDISLRAQQPHDCTKRCCKISSSGLTLKSPRTSCISSLPLRAFCCIYSSLMCTKSRGKIFFADKSIFVSHL